MERMAEMEKELQAANAKLAQADQAQAQAQIKGTAMTEKQKLDAYQVKDKGREKEKAVESALKASKLKPEHITETFKQQLLKVEEVKIGDKTITEADQMKHPPVLCCEWQQIEL